MGQVRSRGAAGKVDKQEKGDSKKEGRQKKERRRKRGQ
jgi:hypothetical protein